MLGITLLVQTVVAQSIFAQDSTNTDPTNSLEIRISSSTVAEIQYSRKWWPALSTDVIIQTSMFGPSLGLTANPLPFAFIQGRVGYHMYDGGQVEDGPVWKPDLMYSYRVGLGIPSVNSKVYILISFGKLWVVDRNFCYTCGGFPPPGVIFTPKYRDEYEIYDMLSIGIGGNL